MRYLSKPKNSGGQGGFTLPEITIAGGLMSVVGLILLQVLWQGTILFTKNTAINVAHQQVRVSVMRIENDLHSSVSVPQLVDAARAPVAGAGPASGIAFHSFAGGPYRVAPGSYLATQAQIDIVQAGAAPVVGQRLNIPTHSVEAYITAVTPSGGNYRLTLERVLGHEVQTTLSGEAVNISCFVTDQIAYLVQAGELRRYRRHGANDFQVLTGNVTSETPFAIPATEPGATYNRLVAAIDLTCAESNAAARNFRASNMRLNSMVPSRSRLTETQ